jgi:hypothetical protein
MVRLAAMLDGALGCHVRWCAWLPDPLRNNSAREGSRVVRYSLSPNGHFGCLLHCFAVISHFRCRVALLCLPNLLAGVDLWKAIARSQNGSSGFKATKEEMVLNHEGCVFVCCSRAQVLKDARVLRAELAVKVGRGCAIGGGAETSRFVAETELFVILLFTPPVHTTRFIAETELFVILLCTPPVHTTRFIAETELFVILLTKKLLTDVRALFEIYTALEQEVSCHVWQVSSLAAKFGK